MKLNWSNEDDNCFWMCFDDFVEIFRELYVCKWFDEKKWKVNSMHGEWDIGGKVTVEGIDIEKERTAVGLPHKHNFDCKVENNPQYTLEVDRPTEIRIKIEQCDANGLANQIVHPIAMYICTPPSSERASRIKSLTRKNVVHSTGIPKRERSLEIYCTLQPGIYVILVGTYVADMDGEFKISTLSNFETELEQLWPPTWRAEAADSFAGKMAIKMAAKVADGAEQAAAAAAKAGEQINNLEASQKGISLFGSEGDLELDDEEKALEAELEAENARKKEEAIKKAQDEAYGAAARGEL